MKLVETLINQVKRNLKKRANTAADIEWNYYQQRYSLGYEISYPTFFTSGDQNYLVYTERGKVYKANVRVQNGSVEFDEPEEIFVEHVTISRSSIVVERTDEGLRFAGIGGVATVNRSLELDSTLLFDSMIENFDENEDYLVNFYHEAEDETYVMGRIKGIYREGNLLYVYGIIDEDTPLGRHAAKNLSENQNEWGFSIEFYPSAYTHIESNGVKIRVYTKGYFNGIAIVLEEDASHYFTNVVA